MATVQLRISELYLQPLIDNDRASVGGRIRNAAVTGLKTAGQGIIGLSLWLLEAGPSLLLIALVLFLPARYLWRHIRSV